MDQTLVGAGVPAPQAELERQIVQQVELGGRSLRAWAAEGVEAKRAKTEYRWVAPTSPWLAPWAQEVIPGGAGFSRVAADDLLPPRFLAVHAQAA